MAGLIYSMLQLGTMNQADLDEAKELLDKSTKLLGDTLEAHFLKGFYAELTGEYEEARKQSREDPRPGPRPRPRALPHRPVARQLGRGRPAVEFYERCRRPTPRTPTCS